MRLRTWNKHTIRSAFLLRVLASSRDWNHCRSCGARMFVKPASGLCPMCFTEGRQREARVTESVSNSLVSETPELPKLSSPVVDR